MERDRDRYMERCMYVYVEIEKGIGIWREIGIGMWRVNE